MQLEVGKIYEGKVTGITGFGAFVEVEGGKTGMVHISEISSTYINQISDVLKEGQQVKVKVLSINDNGKVAMSIKQTENKPERKNERKKDSSSQKQETNSFEEMMKKFQQASEEKMSDLKRSMDSKRGSYSRRR